MPQQKQFQRSGSKKRNIEAKKHDDGDRIQDCLDQLQCDDVSVYGIVSLEIQDADPNAKPRPTRLILASEMQKEKVLILAKNFKRTED
jgi:hypothetical protein